jgi:GAF domain-containing protein/HAMP domain-containing protein
MLFMRSLRAKTLLSVLVPSALGLVAVAVIALYAYEWAARDVVQRRDTELARISAARLSEGLSQYAQMLEVVAAEKDVQSMDILRLVSALREAPSQLDVFDAGVVVYDREGVAVWLRPLHPRRRGTDFPIPSQFDEVRETLRPVFSDVFKDDISGEDVILVAVPIVDDNGESLGVVAGMATIEHSGLGSVYAKSLEFTTGQSGYAYVVDGNGTVLYHRDSSQLGKSYADLPPVMRAAAGAIGAVLSEDETGETIISGFAPIPGTSWGLVTQEDWQDIVGPIRGYSNLLLGLLVVAAVSSGTLVFFSVGRVLRPIQELTKAAQRIAGGDFDYAMPPETGDEVEALGRQFNVMARALKESYEDLEQRVADRTRELAALNAIAAVVSSSLDLEEILDAALDKTLEVMGIEAGGIYLLQGAESEDDEGILTIAAHKGVSPEFVAGIDNLKVGEGFSGHVVQTGEPLVVRDLSQDPRLTRSVVTETGFRAVAVVPVTSREKVWGSLFVVTRGHREFSDRDVDLLRNIGDQIGVAIENARLFDAEQRRAEQFRVIGEMGRRITSVLTTDDLLHEIVRLVKESFGYYLVGISLIEGDELIEKAGIGPPFDDPEFQSPRVKVGGDGITGWVAATGESLLVPDVSKEPRYLFVPGIAGTRSELCVPLKSKEGVFGVLNVESDRLNAFDDSDLAVLQSVARQAAVAIENARLFDAEQHRAEQFRVIGEVGRHMTSILNVDDVLDEIVGLIKETFGYYLVGISLIEGDELIVKAGAGPAFDDPEFQPPLFKVGGEGITGCVASTGEPLLVPDVSEDPRYIFLSETATTKSELCVPIKTKEAVIGVLNVESDQLNAFDESDLVVLQSLANQAAIAIENAQLYEDTKSRLAQVIALQETTRAVASTLELDRLLRLIIEQATTLLQADGGIINVVDWENKEDEAVAATGLAVSALGDRAPLEGSLSGWVALHNHPVISNQLPNDSRADHRALSKLVKETKRQIQSGAIAPLAIKDQVMGTVVVLDKQGGKGEFDQTDLELLVAFANQAAVAIENARLFDSEQRRAEQFRVLSEVGARITSLLAVDELLAETVGLVKEHFGYYLVGIGLVEGDELVVKAGAGPRWDDPQFEPPRLQVGVGISGWVAATGEPLLVPDVSREPRYLLLPDSTGTRSELAVPLRTKSGVIGVLDIQSEQVSAFDETDLGVLQSLANLAAIAIEEARLFGAEQRRAEQFRAISEVGRHMTSILAIDELLDEIVHSVRESLGYYHTAIGLVEGDEVVIKAGAGAHWEDAQFQPSRLRIGGKGITAWVAETGEPLLVPDVSQEARYFPVPESPEIRSEVAVPLKTKSGVIGVLDAQSDQLNAFDESDLTVLQSLANQAAIAIENARLYEQAQQAAALEERSRLARDLHDAVTQTLFSASLISEVVPALWESDQDEGRKLLNELRQLTRGALAEMRTLLLELRPAALAEASLDELLRQLGEAITGRSGVPVTVTIEGECDLPAEVHVALYRVAQEALNNVVKHSRASTVEVSLRCTSSSDAADGERRQTVKLEVTDDGCGFDPSRVPPDRLGLGIIRERAEAIGATLEIETDPGSGTKVELVWKPDQ